MEHCDDENCLVCPLAAVIERMQVAGIDDVEILEVVGDILGFETAVLGGESGSIH
jgi:hypothetical protein